MEFVLITVPLPEPTAGLAGTSPVEVPMAPNDGAGLPMGAMVVGGATADVVGGAITPPPGGVPSDPSSRFYKIKIL